MSDYYKILEIDKNATKDEIKQAFRKKARILHPDVNKEPNAEEKFKELGRAYETLIDDEKRSMYDQFGDDGLKNAGFQSQGPFDFGFGDINEIFESFFGFSSQSSGAYENPSAPRRGSDLRMDIELEFTEAVFGCEKEITVKHLENCSVCNGSGCKPGTNPVVCPACKGHGKVQQTARTALGHFTQITTCPSCKGTGQKITTPCESCHGQGRIEVDKNIKVKIPPGVDTGAKVRISSEGDAGYNGGPAGSLYLVIHAKKSKKYIRDGYNVFSKLHINVPQAVLGDEIEIETLDGIKKVKIPQYTQSGKVITLKYHGVPVLGSNSQRGDHLVEVIVNTPTSITDEEKKLYTKLYEIQSKKNVSNGGILKKVKSALGNSK